MRRVLSTMIILGTIILPLGSCNKDDSLPVQTSGGGSSFQSAASLTLTTNHWELKGNGVFINVFSNIIPSANANRSVSVYLVSNGQDTVINQPISFMDGLLWATIFQRDVVITYRRLSPTAPLFNIKIVIE